MNLALGTPGPFELIIILVVILLLFGAKRLPDLSRSLGKSLSEFKKGREEGLRGGSPAEKIEAPAKKAEAVEEKDNTEN
jgi:sec-independent protein translocase protein TatA